MVVTATAAKDVLPDDAQFVVTPIKSEDAQYEDIAARLEEKAENEEYSIAGFLAYDIYFLNSAGEKINPEDGKVKISMEYKNATAPEEVKESDAVQMDAANQLTNIDWYPATDKADEESVPGAVATSFIMGSTIQRIKKNGVEEYSQMLYNRVHDSALDLFNYPDPALSLCEKHFYSLLQPEDVEDLLALWLYDTKGYVCIPSTNKIATPKYECVLVDPNDLNRKHIYIQVKKGDVDLNTDDYSSLNGEVYLLTTEGNVQNAQKYSNVKVADPTVIYEFAINPDKSHIIPENVLYWVKFLTEIENNRL